jgi:hypothetical protein
MYVVSLVGGRATLRFGEIATYLAETALRPTNAQTLRSGDEAMTTNNFDRWLVIRDGREVLPSHGHQAEGTTDNDEGPRE